MCSAHACDHYVYADDVHTSNTLENLLLRLLMLHVLTNPIRDADSRVSAHAGRVIFRVRVVVFDPCLAVWPQIDTRARAHKMRWAIPWT